MYKVRGKKVISNDSFYAKLEHYFYHFSKYHIKIMLRDFNAKLGREIIFKPTIGNETLHQDSKDNNVRIVNFATSEDLVVKQHDVGPPGRHRPRGQRSQAKSV
jgi:hypothetical protein